MTEHLPLVGIPWIDTWYQWDDEDAFIPVMEEYFSNNQGYQLIIPQNWHDKYTISEIRNEDFEVTSVHFKYLAENKEKVELLVIHHIPKVDWPQREVEFKNDHQSYVLIGENNRNMLVVELPQSTDKLSGDSLKEFAEMLLDTENINKHFMDFNRETLE